RLSTLVNSELAGSGEGAPHPCHSELAGRGEGAGWRGISALRKAQKSGTCRGAGAALRPSPPRQILRPPPTFLPPDAAHNDTTEALPDNPTRRAPVHRSFALATSHWPPITSSSAPARW